MNKDTVIRIFGGNMQLVAQALGCTRQAVQLWAVDARGDLVSPIICDAVLAAMVRHNYLHRRMHPQSTRFELDERTLDDLLAKPERIVRKPKRPIKPKPRREAQAAMA